MKNVGVFLYSDTGEDKSFRFTDNGTLYRVFVTTEKYSSRANRFHKIYVSKKFDQKFVDFVLTPNTQMKVDYEVERVSYI